MNHTFAWLIFLPRFAPVIIFIQKIFSMLYTVSSLACIYWARDYVSDIVQIIRNTLFKSAQIASHGVGLKLDQSLVAHSQNFWATFTQAYLINRTNCRSKLCVWVRVPISLVEVLPGYRGWPVQALYLSLLGALDRSHPHRLLGVSIVLGF